ncbi:SDR family NAD(P)-dependent oxidoreductase [Staphylococcus arlettae]|uniref:SDR family NAD(P)-dependent oxidoreductase n=1 Tax=Staphylococcus arlettae TaxID=29378 RepID=UPI001E519524|nr:SDR family NAD(P)-dependent oxidoreductase [Staphylococcus arlettae]MCD8838556.1 SDR family NAD(P)-dependent oxidoreductase [Staphylococcus arlettae]MCD8866375.1 SDR family NAD(P)-dependent oxidoreductase [Staphylococcus arlettae]
MNNTKKLVLITGASSGLGFELAKLFANDGYDVAMSGSSDRIYNSAREIEKLGVEAFPFQADASTYDGVENFWSFVEGKNRPIDAAVLNVGISIGGAFLDNDLQEELKLIDINISGMVHMAKRVSQHMVANKSGDILIVSSLSATLPTPYETVYGPSKAFGFMFAEALREELKENNINITAMLPGATNTDFHHNAGMDSTYFGDENHKNDKELVAKQGYEALKNKIDHVVCGDEDTKKEAEENRITSEEIKAARHAKKAKPQ